MRGNDGASKPRSPGGGLAQAVVVSGVSGSGKSTAIHALEDLGFFCVDNLPASVIETVLLLCEDNPEVEYVALVIDARAGSFLDDVGPALRRMGERVPTRIVWIDAQSSALADRFRTTRRLHPLGADLPRAIDKERGLLEELERVATDRVDTTHMRPQDLQAAICGLVAPDAARPFVVRLQSFGYRHGVPADADQVVDVRLLPNPYWEPELRDQHGLDGPVEAFMRDQPEVERYLTSLATFLKETATMARNARKSYLAMGVGCTGGQHRSVYVVARLAEIMDSAGFAVSVRHRDRPEG